MGHWRPFHSTRVELERSADYDNGSWMISGLIAHVSQMLVRVLQKDRRADRFDLEMAIGAVKKREGKEHK